MKRYIRSSGLGIGGRTVYYLIDYPDREPIRNIDTGAKYYFDTREEAEQFIEDNPYFQEKYPGLSVTSKKEYSVYHPGVKAATEVTRWTDYLSNDVYRRLQACRTTKDDLPELVNAKWRFMKSQGKDKQGFVKEDALIAVLELLDANSCDRVADLTVDEYEELKR